MRIAVPSSGPGGLSAPVDPRFGRAPFITVVDAEGGELRAEMTIGLEVHVLESPNWRAVVFDLSGQQRFWFLLDLAVSGARVAVYVFDASSPETLYALLDYPRAGGRRILVGNKIDLGIAVTREEAEEVAERIGAVTVSYTHLTLPTTERV